jgi:hypothetical protein
MCTGRGGRAREEFFSPEERRVLASLPPREAIFVKRIMDTFQAVLVEEGQLNAEWVPSPLRSASGSGDSVPLAPRDLPSSASTDEQESFWT